MCAAPTAEHRSVSAAVSLGGVGGGSSVRPAHLNMSAGGGGGGTGEHNQRIHLQMSL